LSASPGVPIHVAVLAAGKSERFGKPKLLEILDGRPVLTYALSVAQEYSPGNVLLVTGKDADLVESAGAVLADRIVFNPDHESGMGSSIAAAAKACAGAADALIVMLADQPMITVAHLRDLADRWQGKTGRIVASSYSGTVGPPVLFGREFLGELAELRGETGAKEILIAHRPAVVGLSFEPASIDIDTPADLATAANLRSRSQK
jgi:molybdenum cofactor cytidylyltransferase